MATLDTSGLAPKQVWRPTKDTSWLVQGRTRYPTTVISADESRNLLTSGRGNDKIGEYVEKGPWRGMPIFLVTLEERATCPKSCTQWDVCYGNGMPFAKRHKHGPRFESLLGRTLSAYDHRHPQGFVVRLHQLGDFYSAKYVRFWRSALERLGALRIFGYTAWPKDSKIGSEIAKLNRDFPDRCFIRFSGTTWQSMGAATIWRLPKSHVVPEGLICPEQTGRVKSCGACGLCFSPAMTEKCIAFVGHGQKKRQPRT